MDVRKPNAAVMAPLELHAQSISCRDDWLTELYVSKHSTLVEVLNGNPSPNYGLSLVTQYYLLPDTSERTPP